MTEDLASLMKVVEPGVERRQCVTLTLAAGLLWLELGPKSTLEETQNKAKEIRLEQTAQAVEALRTMPRR